MNPSKSLRLLGLTAAVLAALTASGGAIAQSSAGAYGGISVGKASDIGTALKLYGGAPLGSAFGWEAQYTDFGSVNEVTPFGTAKASAFALGASLVGYLPLQSNLNGFAKLGAHYVKAKASLAGFSASDTSTEVGFGVGLLWQASPQWGVRAEYENIGGSGGDVISIGVQMKF